MYIEFLIRLLSESFAAFAFIALAAISVLALVVIYRLIEQRNKNENS
jgi:hypothetical protein